MAIARKQNPHMEAYLRGHRKLPKQLPNAYQIGSREEAVCFAERLRMAWEPHSEARSWLAKQPRMKG
jgi:hypothetical protein